MGHPNKETRETWRNKVSGMMMMLLVANMLALVFSSVWISEAQAGATVSATEDTQLTTSPQREDSPAYSPDGQKIVYRAFDSGGWNRHIWIMNADGTNKQQLTSGGVVDNTPCFSPNGSKIFFNRWALRGDYTDLMAMNVDGTGITRLTYGPSGVMYSRPIMSPDGTKIVFQLNYGTTAGPYNFWVGLMDSGKIVHDSTDIQILTPGANPIWVNDGQEILYSLYDESDNKFTPGRIMIMNKDGTNIRQLTSGPFDGGPSMSPDNRKIAFHRASVSQLTDGDIYVMNIDGSNIERLTFDETTNSGPSFNPDLTKGIYEIVYSSQRSGNWDIWVLSSARSGARIYIRADGSMDPPNASISRVNNATYTLTANIYDEIVVERSSIIVDGNGYTLQGPGSGCGFNLTSISNVTIQKTNIIYFDRGIDLKGCSNITIVGNNISNCSYIGINLYHHSDSNIVNGNVVQNTAVDGIRLFDSSGNFVSNNSIIRSLNNGVLLYNSSKNTIEANTIVEGPWDGIYVMFGSDDNVFRGNIISNFSYSGITIVNSTDNIIYHNNFIDNSQQVFFFSSGYVNFWDNGYPSGGNYWSDYEGIDLSPRDGTGDSPYVIDADNQDNFPLMYLWPQISLDETPPNTSDDYDGLWHNSDFVVTLSAVDDLTEIAETHYRINDGPTMNVSRDGQPLINVEGDGNTVEYWSFDNAGNEELPHKILTGIKLDKTAPTGSITANGDAPYTTSTSVMLAVTSADYTSGVYQARYSNDGVWDTELWESPSPTKAWTLLSGDGTKTVYFETKDNAGLVSETYSDTITLDTTPPTGSVTIAGNATYTTLLSVTLTLLAQDVTSTVAQMRFSHDNVTWTPWGAYANSKAWTLIAGDSIKTVYAQFMDNAGLVSPSYKDAIILDATDPIANAGNDRTVNEDTLVTLDASASTDENGIASFTWTFNQQTIQMLTGMNPTLTFETSGEYTVTLKVTDMAGNYATDTLEITVVDLTNPAAHARASILIGWIVVFDAHSSSDNVGVVSYEWNFGDGAAAKGQIVYHNYTELGAYNVTLTVQDGAGNTDIASIIVTIHPPTSRWWTPILIAVLTVLGISTTLTISMKKRKQILK